MDRNNLTRYFKRFVARIIPLSYIGFLDPRGYTFKRILLKAIIRKNYVNIFVETGTYYGDTTLFSTKYVQRVFTCEPYKPFYERFLKENSKLVASQKVYIQHAGSELAMPNFISLLASDTSTRNLFFLDGHYSGQDTGTTGSYCPVFSELDAIALLKTNKIIVIDDYRLFDCAENRSFGTYETGYPSLDELFKCLKRIGFEEVWLFGDCLIVGSDLDDSIFKRKYCPFVTVRKAHI